jgi:hypothetical protein
MINGEGNYVINRSNGFSNLDGLNHNYAHGRLWSVKHSRYNLYVTFENSGHVEVLFTNFIQDVENIRSGTFEFNLVNASDRSDTLKVRNGRFDFESYTLRYTTFD